MKRAIIAFLTSLAVVTTAFAFPPSWQPLLWESQNPHDGISLDFATQTYYTKAPGAPARYAPFTDLFTVTRNSSATFLAQSGYLQYANENLLLYSHTLENAAWSLGNATVTVDNTTAPDGTTTAEKVVEAATTTSHVIGQIRTLTSNAVYTASIYVKPAGRTRAQVFFGKSGSPFTRGCVDVNLSTGAQNASCDVNSPSFTANRTVSDAGNGWWRVSITVRPDTTSTDWYLEVRMHDGTSTTYTGDGSSGVYVWGGQIQRGDQIGQYLQTSANPKYDQPRIEYDVNGKALGFLSEAARTNIALRSQELDDAGWTKSNATITADFGTAADGTASSDKIVEDGAAAIHGVIAGVTVVAGGTYTMSAFVRPAGRTFAFMYGINVDQYGAIFDLTNLTTANITSGTGSVTAKGIIPYPNGVYRIWVSGIMNGSATTLNFVGGPGTSLSVPGGYTYTGDSASGIEMWGIQIEAGPFPSSYMATTSASATRAADSAIRTLGPEFSATAGTVVVAGRASGAQAVGIGQCVWGLWTDVNNRYTYVRPSASDVARLIINNGGVNQATLDATFTNSASFKAASAWVANDFATTINGAAVLTDGAGTLPAVAVLGLGELGDTSSTMNGHILRFGYYSVRKPNGFLVQQSTPGP